MEWIIWTIGWYLACDVSGLIGVIRRNLDDESEPPSAEARGMAALIELIVWIMGMVKFWN